MINNTYCCGCSACVAICPNGAINIIKDNKGFYVAEAVSNQCTHCGLCQAVCPMSIMTGNSPILEYGYKKESIEKRFASQSGGASYFLSSKIVCDGGIIYGVSFFQNDARYIRISTFEQVQKICGSKYIQPRIDIDVYHQIEHDLLDNKKVLITGLPCYISGIKNYMFAKHVDTRNLYTVDLVCHGVPSTKVYNDYANYLIAKYNECKGFNFRDKLVGWHGHVCSFSASNECYISNDYVSIFYSSLCLNECCYNCNYSSLRRVGDITIGDLWGCEKEYPMIDDNMGVSLLLANTEKGKQLIARYEKREMFNINIKKCLQHNLYKATEQPKNYKEFWDDYSKLSFQDVFKKYLNLNFSERTVVDYFWNDYNMNAFFDSMRGNRVVLYGIGLTLFQLLACINEKVHVVGIINKNNKYSGQNICEFGVLHIKDISNKMCDKILICSKQKRIIDIIRRRLGRNKQFDDIEIVDILRFVKHSECKK